MPHSEALKDLETLDPASISPSTHAVFLDFDGTIAPIVEHPEAAYPPKRWLRLVPRLRTCLGGALAIVTGRELADIDKRFNCVEPLCVGAMYGSIRRSAAGLSETAADLADAFAAIADTLKPLSAVHEGLLVEEKAAGVSLHYRARPDLELVCAALMEEAVRPYELIEVIHAKRVFEARPVAVDKGRCIAAFLLEEPFAGRTPIFAGDDVPDEEGFRLVNARGGISIKVGGGETAACYTTRSSASLAAWFEGLVLPGRADKA
jgi:trehalose 6-phosphate phosphatase